MARINRSSKIDLFILCYAGFLGWMSYGLVFPIFPAMIYDHHASFFHFASHAPLGMWLGFLVASSPLAQFLFSPLVGALSDRFGRKPVLQNTTVIMVAGYLLSAFGVWHHSLFWLVLGRVVTGVGAANIAVINSSAADISSPTEKAKNYALIGMANGIGFALGPLIGGQLSKLGYDVPFILAGFFTLLSYFLIVSLFKETHVKQDYKISSILPRLYQSIKATQYRKFNILFPAFFIFCLGWAFYWQFIPVLWIHEYNVGVSEISDFYAFGSAVYVVSSGVLIRPILKRFSGLSILFTSLASLGVFLAVLLPAGLWLYWICIPIQQFFVAMIFPVGTAIVSNLVKESQQGGTLGVFQSLQSCAFSVTPFLGGPLLDISYNSPLTVSCIAMFLAALILFVGYRRKLFKRT